MKTEFLKVGFGGGCHWCAEAVFQVLKGVSQVEQGYLSTSEDPEKYYEGIILNYDPDLIALKTLIEVHLKTHRSSSNHSRRNKYLSAVYTFHDSQQEKCEQILKAYEKTNSVPLITQAVSFGNFEASRPQIQNYYRKDPERPFCKTYITPKINLLKKDFKDSLDQ